MKLCMLILLCSLALAVGCATVPAFPKELSIAAKQISTSVTDQAIWSEVVARLDGQVVEPGIETGAGVKYFAYAKLTGASGQVGLNAQGAGSGQLSPEARAVLLALANDPELIDRLLTLFRPNPTSQPSGD